MQIQISNALAISRQVGYVPVTKIGVDGKGKTITPTIDMAESSQYYTVQKTDDGWMLTAVSDTKP